MAFALISHIHGDAQAFDAVLDRLAEPGRPVILGDADHIRRTRLLGGHTHRQWCAR